MSNCSNCHGSGEVTCLVITVSYDIDGKVMSEEKRIEIVPCPVCHGMEEV